MNENISLEISGIELSRRYYEECAKELFEKHFAPYMDKITIGLVGEGSECFGFDDKLSTDHDYGPSFCVWMSKDLYDNVGPLAQNLYESLPQEYMGISFGFRRETAAGRRGILLTEQFYHKFFGPTLPERNTDWLRVPEHHFAVATNGELFHAPDTEFMRIRHKLLEFFPEEVRLKKIGANLIKMAHAGQVNFNRMAKRGDAVACRMALDQFMEGTIKTLYLLDKKYAPYYKWMWRGLQNVKDEFCIAEKLKVLAQCDLNDYRIVGERIEEIASLIIKLLYEQKLSNSNIDYLENQANSVVSRITDPQLKRLPIMMG